MNHLRGAGGVEVDYLCSVDGDTHRLLMLQKAACVAVRVRGERG